MKKILIFGGYGFIGEKLYLSLKKFIMLKDTPRQNQKN